MAIFISATVKGQTVEGYHAVLEGVRESLQAAPGFILHFAHPAVGEWKIFEVWQSKEQADRWFVKNIVPLLPPGLHPKRKYQVLHSTVTPAEVMLAAFEESPNER